MSHDSVKLCAYAFIGVLVSVAASARAQYQLVDLGTLGTGTYSEGWGMNEAGDVVGDSTTGPFFNNFRGFKYAAGQKTQLPTFGGTSSYATQINDVGQIVGHASVSGDAAFHAFIHANGVMTDLQTLGGPNSEAYGVNNAGQVVGFSNFTANSSTQHAFLYSNGVMTDLGTFGGVNSRAFAINNSGVVVGDAANSSGFNRAFAYANGTKTDLGTLGGVTSTAFAVNDVGQIAGSARTATDQTRAFLYTNGQMISLGTLGGNLSLAHGINNLGDVVGGAGNNGQGTRAFVYTDGVMRDLNTLVDASGTGWFLAQAQDINDAGWITGYGTTPTGQNHGFLLIPIPEPAMSGAMYSLFALMICRRQSIGARNPSQKSSR